MKKLIIILFFLPLLSFSQYFIPFGEDSLYRPSGWYPVVGDMYTNDNSLYICGNNGIVYGSGVMLNEIGRWDGNNWNALGNGMGGTNWVFSITKYQNQIYIGGNFNDIDDIPNTENIGRFNGTTWEGLPNTYGCPNSDVYDIVVWDNKLVVGGGGSGIQSYYDMPFIAAYDGTDYIDINDGDINEIVFALAVFNDELYAGNADELLLKKYIGNKQWEAVGGHIGGYVKDMIVDTFNNFLYVSGGYQVVDDTIPTDAVAFWDGFKWTGIGNGIANEIQNITIYRGNLYIGSSIDTIGGIYTGRLAKWDGIEWSPGVPGGIKFGVTALAVYNDELWIGGGAPNDGVNVCPFDTARKTLARWYLPPTINCNYLQARIQSHTDTFFVNQAVQIQNNNAYVDTWSWDFGDAGTASIQNPYHTYTDTGTYTVSLTVNWQTCQKTVQRDFVVVDNTGLNELVNKEQGFILYPNPTSNNLQLVINNEQLKGDDISIIDINGKVVTQFKIQNLEFIIQVADLAKGTYFVKIGGETQRFVKE